MPKFEKGSEEAKAHMKELRERRKNKTSNESSTQEPVEPKERIIPTKKPRKPRVKKDKIQAVVKDAIDKLFLEGTAEITLPNQVIKMQDGNPKLIDTLTKTGNLKKVDGHKVIDLKTNDKTNEIYISKNGERIRDKTKNNAAEKLRGEYDELENIGND